MTLKNRLGIAILFILLFAAFYALLKVIPADYNDMHDHAAFARDMCVGKIPYTGNFLVYLLVNIFSFFTAGVTTTELSLCGLLALAGTYRYHLSVTQINCVLGKKQIIKRTENQLLASLLALSMLFVFVIPIPGFLTDDHYMYIGTYTPNVWHNSTILFLFPFAILLFEHSWRQLQAFSSKRNCLILLLVILNLLIKPSFFFVFICVFPLMLLYKYQLRKEFWMSIIPVFLGGVLLVVQFVVIYKVNTQVLKDTSSVIFMPFWKNPELREDMINIPISLFFSLLFPITYAVLNFKNLKTTNLFWYISLSFIVSVMIFFFISESGPRASHGNFYWQIIITTWICFFGSLLSLLKNIRSHGLLLKFKISLLLFGIHTVIGFIYFIRILFTGSYY